MAEGDDSHDERGSSSLKSVASPRARPAGWPSSIGTDSSALAIDRGTP